MTTGIYIGGVDIDTLFEKVPQGNQAYSIYNQLVGKNPYQEPETFATVAALQMNTNNGITDLLKRYLYIDYGTRSSSSGMMHFGATTSISAAWQYFDLNDYTCAIGSSGGVPTWATSTSSGNVGFTTSVGTLTNDKVLGVAGSASTGKFPITSVWVTGAIRKTGGADLTSLTASYVTGNPNQCLIEFNYFADTQGTDSYTIEVDMIATNAAGNSVVHTFIFNLDVTVTSSGGGGFPD